MLERGVCELALTAETNERKSEQANIYYDLVLGFKWKKIGEIRQVQL